MARIEGTEVIWVSTKATANKLELHTRPYHMETNLAHCSTRWRRWTQQQIKNKEQAEGAGTGTMKDGRPSQELFAIARANPRAPGECRESHNTTYLKTPTDLEAP